MNFIDYPRFVPYRCYEAARAEMTEKLRRQPGVKAIFQIGSIRHPGISDLDLEVVFEDTAECRMNPLAHLSKSERYIFSHGLYGTKISHFLKARRLSFFHNYVPLWGEKYPAGEPALTDEETKILKTQIALEYLLKMYVNTVVDSAYRLIKVRALLLQTKALLYDLEFLDVTSGRLMDLIKTVVSWRDQWFEKTPNPGTLRSWHDRFFEELTVFLRDIFRSRTLFFSPKKEYRMTKNVVLFRAQELKYFRRGPTFPPQLSRLGKKYFNLQHRFNTFRIGVPAEEHPIPSIVEQMLLLNKSMREHHRDRLPFFQPLTSSLILL